MITPTSWLQSLKVVDCAARIFVNDTNTNGRLTNMLNTLGGEIGVAGLGTRAMAPLVSRDAEGNPAVPYADESDLRTRAGFTPAEIDQMRDFVTFHAWQDRSVIKVPFTTGVATASPTELRAPVNMNTAPKEVLVAVIAGVSATYHKHDPTLTGDAYHDGTKVELSIPVTTARQLADWIIRCRYFYNGSATPISYPHGDWMHVFQDTFDTFPGWPAADKDEYKDLAKAAFCPNTTIKKWNPDIILVDPDISGRTNFSLVDKTDLTTVTTEMCFGSMGHYDIESTGQVWDAGARALASCTLRTAVKTYDVLRLTTQEQFEQYRVFDDGKEPPARSPYHTRLVSVITLPEYPYEKAYPNPAGASPWPGSAVKPARYDGQLALNGWIDHRATPNSFLAGFNQSTYDAFRGPTGVGLAPLDCQYFGPWYYASAMNPAAPGPMLPAAVNTWKDFYTNTNLYPFGMTLDNQLGATANNPKFLLYDKKVLPKNGKGTVEFWFKPMVDLVGSSGWERKFVPLVDTVSTAGTPYLRCWIQYRQVRVYLSDGSGQEFGGGGFGGGIFFDGGGGLFFGPPGAPSLAGASGPAPLPGPGPLPAPGPGPWPESEGKSVTLTGDLTLRTSGPKAWLPHTWHHIEFNWDTAGVAQLFVDGDLMKPEGEKPMFSPFDPATLDPNPRTGPIQGALKVGIAGDPSFDPGPFEDRLYINKYDSKSYGFLGTIDNLCAHDKVLHSASFPSRSRYHDVSVQNLGPIVTFAKGESGADSDVQGNHGVYQRELKEIENAIPAGGSATIYTISCTHYHPPHEHSTGSHTPGKFAAGALGHVSMGLAVDTMQYEFFYDNCAGTATKASGAGWLKVNSGQSLKLIAKMELAESSQIPHNVGPIIDDITVTYSTGIKILSFLTLVD